MFLFVLDKLLVMMYVFQIKMYFIKMLVFQFSFINLRKVVFWFCFVLFLLQVLREVLVDFGKGNVVNSLLDIGNSGDLKEMNGSKEFYNLFFEDIEDVEMDVSFEGLLFLVMKCSDVGDSKSSEKELILGFLDFSLESKFLMLEEISKEFELNVKKEVKLFFKLLRL